MEWEDTELDELKVATKLVTSDERDDNDSPSDVVAFAQKTHQPRGLGGSQDASVSEVACLKLSAGINIGQYKLLSSELIFSGG